MVMMWWFSYASSKAVSKLFALLGKRAPDDPAAIAAGFIALVRGMALQGAEASAGDRARVVLAFLKALIATAPDAEAPKTRR
jgi:hypothetical protein